MAIRNCATVFMALMFVLTASPAAAILTIETAQTEIKGRIIASCEVKVPAAVDLGEINRRDILRGSESGVRLYAIPFSVTTTCVAGTDKYRLKIKTDKVTASGCADAESGEMAFCLYHGGKLVGLNGQDGGSVDGTTDHAEEVLSVLPARGSKGAAAGEHNASVTVTVEPR